MSERPQAGGWPVFTRSAPAADEDERTGVLTASAPAASVTRVRLGRVPSAMRRRRRSEGWIAAIFIAPALFGFTLFYLVPTLRGLYLSFMRWNLLSPPEYVGLSNYETLLGDPLFWNALRVTALYVVLNIGPQTIIALGMALLMDRFARSIMVRAILLFPYLIPNVIVALVWLWMLDFQLGITNHALDAVGLNRVPFLGSSGWVIPAIAGINTWRHMGYTALLLFAGLQMIPRDLYEAAAVDGASERARFFRITLPLLRPVLALVLIMTIIGSFQVFDTVDVTTGGGPIHSSRVIYYYIFERAFRRYDMGYAAALAAALFILLVGITIAQLRLLRAGKSDL